jgi:GDP-L-fucose synthase
MNNNILILGSNGFLGKSVTKIFDDNNVKYLSPPSKELNLLNASELDNYLSRNKVDCIVHLSALCGGIKFNQDNPAKLLYENTMMGLNVYEQARLNGVKKIYSMGTICMYPKFCPSIPFLEDDIWSGSEEETNKPYSEAKRNLLMLSQTYRQQWGVGGVFLVPLNLYGPQDSMDVDKSHVIPGLIVKMLLAKKNKEKSIKAFGTGSATRSFLYVEDLAQCIYKVVSENLDIDVPINVGTQEEILIKDLAYLIKDLTEFDGEIIFSGEVSDGQPRRLISTERCDRLLDFTATTTLREGLIKTISWYKEQIK